MAFSYSFWPISWMSKIGDFYYFIPYGLNWLGIFLLFLYRETGMVHNSLNPLCAVFGFLHVGYSRV